MHEKIYALVEHRQIVLFPLTEDDINQRNIPNDNYHLCYFDDEPTYDPILEYVVEIPKLIGISVFVRHEVRKRTIDEVFTFVAGLQTGETPITIADVPLPLFYSIVKLVKDKTQSLMDAFAATRGYDNMGSLCNYNTSSVLSYQQEAARGIYLRDTTWTNLNNYINGVQTGEHPVPTSWSQIEVFLPAYTWE